MDEKYYHQLNFDFTVMSQKKEWLNLGQDEILCALLDHISFLVKANSLHNKIGHVDTYNQQDVWEIDDESRRFNNSYSEQMQNELEPIDDN